MRILLLLYFKAGNLMSHLSFACLFSKISHVVKMAWEKRGCCSASPRRQAAARLERHSREAPLPAHQPARGSWAHRALSQTDQQPQTTPGAEQDSETHPQIETNSAPRLWPLPHSPAPVPSAFAPGAAGISYCWSHPSSCHLLEPTWTLQVLAPKCSGPPSQASYWHGAHTVPLAGCRCAHCSLPCCWQPYDTPDSSCWHSATPCPIMCTEQTALPPGKSHNVVR